jgi:hypothetical protein
MRWLLASEEMIYPLKRHWELFVAIPLANCHQCSHQWTPSRFLQKNDITWHMKTGQLLKIWIAFGMADDFRYNSRLSLKIRSTICWHHGDEVSICFQYRGWVGLIREILRLIIAAASWSIKTLIIADGINWWIRLCLKHFYDCPTFKRRTNRGWSSVYCRRTEFERICSKIGR